MYKRILAAVDGSRAARLALDEALKIAKASDGEVIAVFVVEHTSQLVDVAAIYTSDQSADGGRVDAATAALEDARTALSEQGVNGMTRAVDAYGDGIAEVISRTADECEADLITMGTHGRHAKRRMLPGSAAQGLLRLAHVPVLLVRHDAEAEEQLGDIV
ncbi:universal stress protein [Trinickia dinghuensis]|uniref:Universal stress protein n=1 Tax=Trinickia dinghuensis TaxID=2291023 RepID=A0A3D8K331_9BURK|nr:universal stress protein [Trinickia dinghuensis]RDU99285.1 universal stress protein [Trinickia dinghuensis]